MIKKILLIDDDADDHIVFEHALTEVDAQKELNFANHCLEVLEELENCKPDLVFLDINMPLKNGFECIQEIKESAEFCNIPIIMYSCSSYIKDINKASELGAVHYFVKPNSIRELVAELKAILKKDWKQKNSVVA